MIPVDLKMGIVKPLSAQWIELMLQYFKSNPRIVQMGSRKLAS